MFKLTVPFPARESLRQMLDVSLDAEPSDTLQPIAGPRRCAAHHASVPHGAAWRPLQGSRRGPGRGDAARGRWRRFRCPPAHSLRRQPAGAAGAGPRGTGARPDGRPFACRCRRISTPWRCPCCAIASCCGWRASSTASTPTPRSHRSSTHGDVVSDPRRTAERIGAADLRVRGCAVVDRSTAARIREPRTVKRRAGVGIQHFDHRDYAPGDEVRHIDWRQTARRRRPIVRRFESESVSDWTIVLDASSSMAAHGAAKWQAAVRMAAAMSYALLQLGHRVGCAGLRRTRAIALPSRARTARTTP